MAEDTVYSVTNWKVQFCWNGRISANINVVRKIVTELESHDPGDALAGSWSVSGV